MTATHLGELKRLLLLVLLLISTAFGQSKFAGPSKLAGPSSTGTPAVTVGVSKIGTLNFSTGSPYTLTVTGNAAIGDTVLLGCWGNTANAGTHYNFSVSDSVSNTWTFTNGTTNTNLQSLDTTNVSAIQTPYASNIATGYTSGVTTLTVTIGVADGSTGGCDLLDITGLLTSPLDQISGVAGAFSTTQTSSTVTPSQQPEVVIMIGCFTGGDFSAYGNIMGSAATGIDNRTGGATGNPAGGMLEWRRVTALTAGNGTYTISTAAAGFSSVILTLKSN